MKTAFALTIAVILLCGCAASGSRNQSNVATSEVNVTVVNSPSFDCTSQDDYLVTTGDVYGYSDHNGVNPIFLIKVGFVLKVVDVYRAGISPSANTVWYQVSSPELSQTIWIDAYKAGFESLPCAPMFVK
ncbi:hypothetical protein M0R04_01375 [Candidatus Dojkabacteria bacterium]|jgi:hypothetical protein|nr:hypothetical protein [Candidatus Dojkabacteria bacterium]